MITITLLDPSGRPTVPDADLELLAEGAPIARGRPDAAGRVCFDVPADDRRRLALRVAPQPG